MTNEVRDPVREFLSSYWEARREEARLKRRAEELTCQCESITAKYGGVPRGGGGGNTTMTAWDALIEAKSRVDRKIVEWAKLEAEIEAFISSLDDPSHREVLRYRYLEGLWWEDIGARMNYHPDHVRRRIHGAALQAARQKWEEREAQKA